MPIDKPGELYPQTGARAKQHTEALIPRRLFSYTWKTITSTGPLGHPRIHTDLENTTSAQLRSVGEEWRGVQMDNIINQRPVLSCKGRADVPRWPRGSTMLCFDPLILDHKTPTKFRSHVRVPCATCRWTTLLISVLCCVVAGVQMDHIVFGALYCHVGVNSLDNVLISVLYSSVVACRWTTW